MKNNGQIYIEYMPLEDLRRAPRNPKDHDLGAIHQSVNRFDFVSPLLINEATGKLVAGHGRLDVLQQMKASGKKSPRRVKTEGDSWLVPVIRGVEFANDADAEAYLLADNRLTELGGWHNEQLAQVLADLATQGDEMLEGIGWDKNDVDGLISACGPGTKHGYRDDIPESFQVLVDCETESQQVTLLNMLQEKGYSCRALVS